MFPQFSRDKVFACYKDILQYAESKVVSKNRQYADDRDGLSNLSGCEVYGVSVEDGIIARLADKLRRIAASKRDPVVRPHSLGYSEHGIDNNDIPDMINYLALLYVVRVARREGHQD